MQLNLENVGRDTSEVTLGETAQTSHGAGSGRRTENPMSSGMGSVKVLFAKSNISFIIEDDALEKVRQFIRDGEWDEAREILSDAMLSTYEFCGQNYIPDDNRWTNGIKELADFEF